MHNSNTDAKTVLAKSPKFDISLLIAQALQDCKCTAHSIYTQALYVNNPKIDTAHEKESQEGGSPLFASLPSSMLISSSPRAGLITNVTLLFPQLAI